MILPESAAPMSVVLESDLVSRARSGDSQAQEELALRHRRSAYLLALQLVGNPEDALDVTQDAMLRFFSTLHRFDVSRPVKPWLFQIIRNRVQDLRRRHQVRRYQSLDEVDEDGGQRIDVVDTGSDPEHRAASAQLRVRVWQALNTLSPGQREILVLRDYQDLSYAEIAATLAIPIGTVMSRLHAARQRLRQVLQADLRTAVLQ